MQVTQDQIRRKFRHTYPLWDGEMMVTVYQHQGAYRHWSAALVVERIDSPLETFTWDGYQGSSMPGGGYKPTDEDMRTWIAERLTELSTGVELNAGGVGNVEGLLVPKKKTVA